MENEAAAQFCALCGNSIPEGKGVFVIEGTICESCSVKRAAAKARRLGPLALIAVACALLPLAISYSTEVVSTDFTVHTTVTTRILIFSSSNVSAFEGVPSGAVDSKPVRKFSDPVALAFGGVAVLFALVAIWRARKDGAKRAAGFAIGAALLGVWHVLHGRGIV